MVETESRLENITGKALGVALGVGAVAVNYNSSLDSYVSGSIAGGILGFAVGRGLRDCGQTKLIDAAVGSSIGALGGVFCGGFWGNPLAGVVAGALMGAVGGYDINISVKSMKNVIAYTALSSVLVFGGVQLGRNSSIDIPKKTATPVQTNRVEEVRGY